MSERDQLLEMVAARIEGMGGNDLYRKAYKKAAKMVRAMKILTGQPQKLNDAPEQISSVSRAGHASPAGRLVSEN